MSRAKHSDVVHVYGHVRVYDQMRRAGRGWHALSFFTTHAASQRGARRALFSLTPDTTGIDTPRVLSMQPIERESASLAVTYLLIVLCTYLLLRNVSTTVLSLMGRGSLIFL